MEQDVRSLPGWVFRCVGAAIMLLALTSTPVLGDSLWADSSTGLDSVTVGSVMDDGSDGGDESAFVYPMSEERKALLVDYSRFNNVWRFVSFFLGIALLSLILFTGLSARMRNWAGAVRSRFLVMWLFLVMFLVVDYILNLPFSIYRSFVVESNYGFMNQTFMEWWGDDLLSLLLAAVFGIIPMWFLYWLMGKFKKWWLVFSIGAIPFVVLMMVVIPIFVSPLFNEFEPLKDKQLETELSVLAEKAGIEGADIFQVDGSKQSSKINAYVTGMFGAKRIVLYDTMIDNFTINEIKFVMGHEMGHYTMHHLWWGLGVALAFMTFGLWLTNRTIHGVIARFRRRFGFDHLADIASLPLLLIFLSVFSFVFQPVTAGASRFMERQSDEYGMDLSGVTGDEAATAFDKLSVFNLSDPDPNALIEFWFYSHPSLKKRMEFVRGYRQ